MKFKASLDSLAKSITIGISVLFFIIIVVHFVIAISTGEVFMLVVPVLLIALFCIIYYYRPVSYSLTNENLIISHPFSNVIIERKNIKQVTRLTLDNLKGAIRTFGVGGMFGYFGKFANSRLGSMVWYVTRKDTTVLIETFQDKKLIISPDDPEEFIKQVAR